MTDITPADGGQGATQAAAQTTAQTTQAVATPPIAWLPNADELTVGYLQNKGWTDPGQVVDGYRNLEKLFGSDRAGNTVAIPKPDAAPEEWGKFYDRLGRPASPDEYKISAPEGGNADFAKAAATKFHELGISAKQAQELTGWWNEQAQAQTQQTQEQAQARFQQDDTALRTEWGQAYQQNLTQAQAAVRGLGVTSEQIDAMSQSMGHKATMQFFQQIGSRMGEAEFVHGGQNERFGNALTPAQAKAEIQQLRQDKSFINKLTSKDTEATQRWTRLHEFAFPEGQ